MTIKVTLEFASVDQAIVALGKLVGTASAAVAQDDRFAFAGAAMKAARKGRADKGQKRGEYKPRETNAAPQASPDKGDGAIEAGSGTGADPKSSLPPSAPAVAAPSPADTVKAEILQQQTAHAPVSATIGEKDAEAQKAMETLHGKKGLDACRVLLGQFGVSRIREIPTARRAEFLAEAGKAAV